MTTRATIITTIMTSLQGLNGFVTISRHRDLEAEPFDPSEVPAVNLVDGYADTTEGEPLGSARHVLPVTATLCTGAGTTATEADALLESVLAAILADRRREGLAEWTYLIGHGLDLAECGDTVIAGKLDFQIHYITGLSGM